MWQPSAIDGNILINDELAANVLSDSLMCTNAMKLLEYAGEHENHSYEKRCLLSQIRCLER